MLPIQPAISHLIDMKLLTIPTYIKKQNLRSTADSVFFFIVREILYILAVMFDVSSMEEAFEISYKFVQRRVESGKRDEHYGIENRLGNTVHFDAKQLFVPTSPPAFLLACPEYTFCCRKRFHKFFPKKVTKHKE